MLKLSLKILDRYLKYYTLQNTFCYISKTNYKEVNSNVDFQSLNAL